ncbi:hypothetical protein [Rhodococcus sp. Q1]|uniref:Rv0361 family membrane protein n=1 Tax=Rhodococcus sp. Q1 TaxID=2508718 RepID=UPI0010222B18|nr:hypothetical protein [Rhodococcus sp. Q1]
MAKRGAPEPDPDPDPGPDPDGPTSSSTGPFLGALAVLVVLVLVVFGAQMFSPPGADLTEDEMVRRAVTDYVSAHNENDRPILDRLRCSELSPDDAPLADVEGRVELQAAQNISVDGDRATVDVRTGLDGQTQTETWQVVRIDDVWRICRF